mmetsp:Transcript_3695/g.8569  ORF Transcript_3695/g.8569 Transcript_3695/m.8569 type:complete len:228 (+) Transcript_3695:642-1325(+)
MKPRASVVKEDHTECKVAKLVCSSTCQVMSHASPDLNGVGQASKVDDPPRNANVHRLDLKAHNPQRLDGARTRMGTNCLVGKADRRGANERSIFCCHLPVPPIHFPDCIFDPLRTAAGNLHMRRQSTRAFLIQEGLDCGQQRLNRSDISIEQVSDQVCKPSVSSAPLPTDEERTAGIIYRHFHLSANRWRQCTLPVGRIPLEHAQEIIKAAALSHQRQQTRFMRCMA